MRVTSYQVANYKAYRRLAKITVRPITILVGRNHAGKSALLRALPLIAHSLAGAGRQVLQLEAGGLRHGSSFEELVHGQHVHGHVELGLAIEDDHGPLALTARIQNIHEPETPVTAVLSRLELESGESLRILLERRSVQRQERRYRAMITASGVTHEREILVDFDGLLPRFPRGALPATISDEWEEVRLRLRSLGERIHYLRAQRLVPGRYLELPPEVPGQIGIDGALASEVLAADDGLRRALREWFLNKMNIAIDVSRQGPVFDLLVSGGAAGRSRIPLENAGHGLSQLLPVVVGRLAAQHFGPGVDLIEQPESDLHPGAHGAVADLFVDTARHSRRAVVVETHSEMFLLRIRRRIAEGRLPTDRVAVYWVDADPAGGALLREIRITPQGDLEDWPEGVFYEDFEEVLAIRRAGREAAET